jgi:signal peptidase I
LTVNFFENRKTRKQLKTLLHHARTLRCSRGDVMNTGELAFLDEHVAKARAAYDARGREAMEASGGELEKCLTELNPPKPMAGWRENFDVLVVAISVAMAFRAYFYQPFKIPTGSMMPTLYGIHSEARPFETATVLDVQPFKFAKWLVTGESFKAIRAKATGEVRFTGDTNSKPGYMLVTVGGYKHYVPSDAVQRDSLTGAAVLSGTGLRHGQRVKSGDVLWSGLVISGDFVFVNRWKWNFAHPTRGEVMVFSTTGIPHLIQGTHYIKRMMGLPGETLQVRPPDLLVNGEPVAEPERVGMIARKETPPRAKMAYSGFNPNSDPRYNQPGTLPSEKVSVTLGPDRYYAMGDNSHNSFDSRYWGPVPERNLLGPAAVVYWPLTSPRFGRIR